MKSQVRETTAVSSTFLPQSPHPDYDGFAARQKRAKEGSEQRKERLNEKALDSSTFAELDSILSNQHHFQSRSFSSFSPPLPCLRLRLAGFVARSTLYDFCL